MQKRYQVFISSTYQDLQEERQLIYHTLMDLDCIPVGMEVFPAIDDDQFNYIKHIIDDSDYYLLIIGGRYGSCDKDGISYTEKEFDYAISKKIPVISFIHGSPKDIILDKSEQDKDGINKLENFKAKVTTSRLVRYWNTKEQLPGLVATSLPKTIKMYPAIGWVRGDSVSSSQQVDEINSLLKENKKLKEQLSVKNKSINLEILSTKYTILVNNNIKLNKIELTLFDIFKNITLNYIEEIIEQDVVKDLFDYIKTIYPDIFISQINFEVVIRDLRNKFRALDIIDMCYKNNDLCTVWSLSGKGEELVKAIYLAY